MEIDQELSAIKHSEIIRQNWEKVTEEMGIDLDQTARETKALQRRREIRNADDLLRMILFYAMSGWGLCMTGAWALVCGIGYLSDIAVRNRLRNSCAWLGKLVAMILQQRCTALKKVPGVRLRIMDATCISQPGSKGVDWRVHFSFDLGNLCVDHVELTDKHGGENLARFEPQNNEIIIGDSGYAFASGMGPLLASGAGLIVRINWRNVAVYDLQKHRFHIIPWLKTLTYPAEVTVFFETPQGWFPLRLIASPLPPEKAEEARRRVKKRHQRKQKQLSQETIFAAGFVLLLTTLPLDPWPIPLILFLYRARWQIELVFKRLKNLLDFDHLRAKDPRLAQAFLLAKILIALIIDQLIHQVHLHQPDWFISLDHPVNLSHLSLWYKESLRSIIFGTSIHHNLPSFLFVMRRYFCDPPRKRPQQLAWARALFQHVVLSSPCPLS